MQRYPVYKDSGFDWLGEIPTHWKLERIKHMAVLINEKSDDHSDCFHLSLEDIEGHTGQILNSTKFEGSGNLFKKDDVLFSKLRPYLAKVVIAPQNGVGVGEFLILRAKAAINHHFLHARMLSKPFIDIVESSTYGAKMPRANWGFVGNLQIPVPPLDEQKAIVAFLEEQTAVIHQFLTNKRRLIALLEEQKQVVINTAVTQGLNSNSPRKPSGIDWLGDIPAHWELKRLGWITSEINDINHEMPMGVAEGVPFLSAKDLLNDGTLNFEHEVKMISEEDFEELSKKVRPQRGDIIYSRIGARLGKARIVNTDIKFLISYSCCVVRVIPQKAHAEYVQLIMDSDFVLTEAKLRTVGVGVPDLGLKQIARFPIPLPPLDEQLRIVEFLKTKLSNIQQAIERTQREIELIEEYRTTLIAHAVTGKIDVRSVV